LRGWCKQADIDDGSAPRVSTAESEELKRLRRDNAELRRANEILKTDPIIN
jgi:transposase